MLTSDHPRVCSALELTGTLRGRCGSSRHPCLVVARVRDGSQGDDPTSGTGLDVQGRSDMAKDGQNSAGAARPLSRLSGRHFEETVEVSGSGSGGKLT